MAERLRRLGLDPGAKALLRELQKPFFFETIAAYQ
jgi:hypothetical protein